MDPNEVLKLAEAAGDESALKETASASLSSGSPSVQGTGKRSPRPGGGKKHNSSDTKKGCKKKHNSNKPEKEPEKESELDSLTAGAAVIGASDPIPEIPEAEVVCADVEPEAVSQERDDQCEAVPITVAIHYIVRWECKDEFTQEIEKTHVAMQEMPGFLSLHMLHDRCQSSSPLNDPQYTVLFKFAGREPLEHWEKSDARNRCMNELERTLREKPNFVVEKGAIFHHTNSMLHDAMTSLYTSAGSRPPPLWKVTIMTMLALQACVWSINSNLNAPFSKTDVPLWGYVLITTFLSVSSNAYLAVPVLTLFFRHWLNDDTHRNPAGTSASCVHKLLDSGFPSWYGRLFLFLVYAVPLVYVAAQTDVDLAKPMSK